MRTLTRKQAKAEGYIIDDYAPARGPIGYKGLRFGSEFQPVNVLSEREEKLVAALRTLSDSIRFTPLGVGPLQNLAAADATLADLNIEGEV